MTQTHRPEDLINPPDPADPSDQLNDMVPCAMVLIKGKLGYIYKRRGDPMPTPAEIKEQLDGKL